jgi:hypothetical protein
MVKPAYDRDCTNHLQWSQNFCAETKENHKYSNKEKWYQPRFKFGTSSYKLHFYCYTSNFLFCFKCQHSHHTSDGVCITTKCYNLPLSAKNANATATPVTSNLRFLNIWLKLLSGMCKICHDHPRRKYVRISYELPHQCTIDSQASACMWMVKKPMARATYIQACFCLNIITVMNMPGHHTLHRYQGSHTMSCAVQPNCFVYFSSFSFHVP